ncbi:hypothetical protein Y1Q_0023754 [Alligator mississippiensis]|uniref:FAM194 C-terminal domain-containing protein n=1 Tax=Alligator mississippiensis TaxID=8496 RepID=A0A151MK11_ALLMI|nr:hypothetical protein Y1Q_0023754 [Alligator mississippiensis]
MNAKRSTVKLFEEVKASAPEILAQIIQLLATCHKMGIHVPRGIKNIFEFTWEELILTSPRKVATGDFFPIVHLSPALGNLSSGSLCKPHIAKRTTIRGARLEPKYASPSAENQQILFRFQQRSIHLLSELLKLKMQAMINSVSRYSTDDTSKKFLEAAQLLRPRNQEEAAELMAQTPKKKVLHGIYRTIQISSTIQIVHQVPMSCISFSLSSKTNKQLQPHPSSKFKAVKETPPAYQQFDPCPEARQKLKEMCRRIEEENAAIKAKGHTRPLILRNYAATLLSPSISVRKARTGEPQVRQPTGPKSDEMKFYFAFPDGGSLIFYPTGNIAVCQLPLCCMGKCITLLFNDFPSLDVLACFAAEGQACVHYSFKARCSLALMMDLGGGIVRDRDGYVTHEWTWSSGTFQSLEFQINDQLKLKVLGQNTMTVFFTSLGETIHLSLSRSACPHACKVDKRGFSKTSNIEESEYQLKRALVEIKKRFQRTVKQFINAILMASGLYSIDYPVLQRAKQMKFKTKAVSPQTWTQGVKEKDASVASDTKRPQKPSSRQAEQKTSSSRLSSRAADEGRSHLAIMTRPKPAPRVKIVAAGDKHSPSAWASSMADCPIVLRKLLTKEDTRPGCKCIVKIPFVTDLEFDKFISAPRKSDQILVIFVFSSQSPACSPILEETLQNLYIEKQHGRPSPCIQCKHDSYRLLRYDMDSSARQQPPLLVQKHAVTPGMVLMYAGGKLLFGGYVFNGYGCSKKDLLKQISKARLDCKMGHFLPESFKFSTVPLEDHYLDTEMSKENKLKIVSKEFFPMDKDKAPSCTKINDLDKHEVPLANAKAEEKLKALERKRRLKK